MPDKQITLEQRVKIKGFDGIRGLAVLSVVLTHLSIFNYLLDIGILSDGVVLTINGVTGVQVFFVLSGFLITMLLIREHETEGEISIKKFYIRRALRIVPLYTLFLIWITTTHAMGTNVASWESLLFAYTYIYNFVPHSVYYGVLGHTWSLAVEEHFYLIWPLIFSAFFYKKNNRLMLGLVSFVCVSFLLLNIFLRIPWLDAHFFVGRWSFIAGSDIALGCIGALLFCGESAAVFYQNLFKKKAVLFLGLILLCNAIFVTHDFASLSTYLRGFGILLIIAWLYLNQDSRLVGVLEFRPLKYIGLISYGIYMYQGFFLATGPYRKPLQSWPPNPTVGLILLIIIAPLSFHFFEKPFLKLKSKYHAGRY